MIYVQIIGRLGNHLFQYAFAKEIQKKTGDDIAIDWSKVEKRHGKHGDGWENSFSDFQVGKTARCNLEDVASTLQKKILLWNQQITYHRYLHIFIPAVKFISQFFGVYVCMDAHYFPYCYFRSKNKIILGYFESDRYFEDMDTELQAEYRPAHAPLPRNKHMLQRIQETQSICVTIRRGDYFNKKNARVYGLCDEKYYLRGVEYIRSQYPEAVVFFFSDDIEWVKQNIIYQGEAYYETGEDPLWEKLQLMSSCKHFVISNSTFSWWAQYLSEYKKKIVVAPKIWRANDSKYDIRQKHWILY